MESGQLSEKPRTSDETTSGQTTPRAKPVDHGSLCAFTQNIDLSKSNFEEQSENETVLSVCGELVTEFTKRIEDAHSISMEVDWIGALHHTGNARSCASPSITFEECREIWDSAGKTIKELFE
ncbi:hypothetical protein V865_002860 [Kwoniella europaea PYCC6329]|uniref:Uncharacterized protein n=1 Tax=Kwoniella europaea PYCC6329 TaxID=1423913 RepID=A0AAX4KFI0_9TREE